MKKKIKNEAGVTLVEMLAAVLVLVLLSLMVGTGMSMATHSYETIVAQSEAELLLSTAVDALADDLRYAWDVTDDTPPDLGIDYNGVAGFTYSSDSYGEKTRLCVKGGKIIAKNDSREWQVLANNAGAYGKDEAYKEYKVDGMEITHNSDNTFTIHLKVTDDSGISASTPGWDDATHAEGGVTVRCLNPPA